MNNDLPYINNNYIGYSMNFDPDIIKYSDRLDSAFNNKIASEKGGCWTRIAAVIIFLLLLAMAGSSPVPNHSIGFIAFAILVIGLVAPFFSVTDSEYDKTLSDYKRHKDEVAIKVAQSFLGNMNWYRFGSIYYFYSQAGLVFINEETNSFAVFRKDDIKEVSREHQLIGASTVSYTQGIGVEYGSNQSGIGVVGFNADTQGKTTVQYLWNLDIFTSSMLLPHISLTLPDNDFTHQAINDIYAILS